MSATLAYQAFTARSRAHILEALLATQGLRVHVTSAGAARHHGAVEFLSISELLCVPYVATFRVCTGKPRFGHFAMGVGFDKFHEC